MINPYTTLVATAATAGAVAAADLATKSWARAHAPDPGALPDPRTLRPAWVHGEHPGPPALGAVVAIVPAAVGAGLAAALTRFAGPSPLVIPAAALLATGAVLNGAELAVRGSNTNPIDVAGIEFNVADLAVVAGAALLALSVVPAAARLLVR